MRRMSIAVGAAAFVILLIMPSVAMAYAGPAMQEVPRQVSPIVTDTAPLQPLPTETPSTPSGLPASGEPQVDPASGGSTTAADALTIVGFSVVAMAGLVLIIRAGLRSAGAEDDD